MPNRFIFADEAGNFDFTRNQGASRFFVLTTVTTSDCNVGESLLRLRRELIWEGLPVGDGFHATEEVQSVRDRVFAEIVKHPLRVDSTILEKPKAQPQTRASDERFYKLAWYLHFKHVAPQVLNKGDSVQVVSASLGTKKRMAQFRAAVEDVASQVVPRGVTTRVGAWSAASDPCLQAADYCCWAIQRKWERGDARSHAIIAPLLRSEYDVWQSGSTLYY